MAPVVLGTGLAGLALSVASDSREAEAVSTGLLLVGYAVGHLSMHSAAASRRDLAKAIWLYNRDLPRADPARLHPPEPGIVGQRPSPAAPEDYLQERARRGGRARYETALEQVPDVEPEERDRL